MQYLILFRGINVGGRHIVKMDDLKKFLLNEKLENVKTYLQSGNAIVTTNLKKQKLEEIIKRDFKIHFGFDSEIILLTKTELLSVIKNIPFSKEEIESFENFDPKVTHLYVYFFNKTIDQDEIESSLDLYKGEDKLVSRDRWIYLLCKESIRKSKLAVKMAKRYSSVTVRNINSVNKIYKLMCD